MMMEVRAPGHMIRHVLLDADAAAIPAPAGSVTVPTTSIKGFMESEDPAHPGSDTRSISLTGSQQSNYVLFKPMGQLVGQFVDHPDQVGIPR